MSETQLQPGGLPIPALTRIATDSTSIAGSGAADDPIATVAGGTPVVTDGTTITGNGTTNDPLVAAGSGGLSAVAIARIASDGSVISQTGISTVEQTDTGEYSVTLAVAHVDTDVVPVAMLMKPGAATNIIGQVSEGAILISTSNDAGDPTDGGFALSVFVVAS